MENQQLPTLPVINDIVVFEATFGKYVYGRVLMTNIIGAICSYVDDNGNGRYKMVKWESVIVEVPHGCLSSPEKT